MPTAQSKPGYRFHDADVIAPEVYGNLGHPLEAFAGLRANDPLRLAALKSSFVHGLKHLPIRFQLQPAD